MLKDKGFGEMVLQELNAIAPEGMEFEIMDVPKVNTVRAGVTFKGKKNKPVIYLEEAEAAWESGKAAVGEIALVMMEKFLEVCPDEPPRGKCPFNIKDWNEARAYVMPFLCNAGMNKADGRLHYLRNDFCDLYVMYQLAWEEGDVKARAVVSHEILEQWGISEDELHEAAMENMREKAVTKRLNDEIARLAGESLYLPDLDVDVPEDGPTSAWEIITTKDTYYGAAALLVTDKVREVADKVGDDLFIIPSSIHEAIVVPVGAGDVGADTIKGIVMSVNRSDFINEEEFLSDTVYKYSRETGEITIAA